MEANVSLGELQQKIKRLEGLCQVSIGKINAVEPLHHGHLGEEMITKRFLVTSFSQELRKNESSIRTERDQWRDQATANKHEVEKLRGQQKVFSFKSVFWFIFVGSTYLFDIYSFVQLFVSLSFVSYTVQLTVCVLVCFFFPVDISKQFSDADEVQAELAKVKLSRTCRCAKQSFILWHSVSQGNQPEPEKFHGQNLSEVFGNVCCFICVFQTKQEILVLQKELFLAGNKRHTNNIRIHMYLVPDVNFYSTISQEKERRGKINCLIYKSQSKRERTQSCKTFDKYVHLLFLEVKIANSLCRLIVTNRKVKNHVVQS